MPNPRFRRKGENAISLRGGGRDNFTFSCFRLDLSSFMLYYGHESTRRTAHFPLPLGKEAALDCLPMASKPVSAAVFALLVHVFSSSGHAVCHLEHPRIQIYMMIYMFHTTLKEGFATASLVRDAAESNPCGLPRSCPNGYLLRLDSSSCARTRNVDAVQV